MSIYFIILCLLSSILIFYKVYKNIIISQNNLLSSKQNLIKTIDIKKIELNSKRKSYREKQNKLKKLVSRVDTLANTKKTWVNKQNSIKLFVAEKINISEIISLIEKEIVEVVWFEKISINLPEVNIDGCSIDKEAIFILTKNFETNESFVEE